MISCESVQYRFLRKWLRKGFEQSLECGSLAEPPEVLNAGDFFLRVRTKSYRVRERLRMTFQRSFYLISDPQKRGAYVTFV